MDKLDGKIDNEFFTRKRAEWEEQRAQALDEMERLKRADTANLDLGVELIELGKSCYHLYLQKSAFEQRQLLETVGSNSYLAGGELRLEWRKPFKFLADMNEAAQNGNAPSTAAEGAFPVWWSITVAYRTFLLGYGSKKCEKLREFERVLRASGASRGR